MKLALCVLCASCVCALSLKPPEQSLLAPGEERHLAGIRRLTHGGENAEAYWSADGKKIIFMSNQSPNQADQIFTMNADGAEVKLVSTGKGRTT